MKRSIALSILLAGISTTGLPRAEMPDAYVRSGYVSNVFAGKSGNGLVAAIRYESLPSRLADIGEISYVFYDPFEAREVNIVHGVMPDGYEAAWIVPSSWWDNAGHADSISRDLHNFIPLTSAAAQALAQRRPGEVSVTTTDYTRWSVGWSEVYGTQTDLYAPPAGMRGRIARAYFYVAAVYHHDMMRAEGYMMMKPDYPYLTPYAVGLLCRWNREEAPDETEKGWNDYVCRLQGAGNPFVSDSSLAEYIWGDKAGDVYAVEGEAVPLHSSYRMGSDRIYLFSPHVPDDAVWAIDGTPAQADSYDPRDLGVGEHHLTYTSASTGRNGRVLIKIVEK